MERDETQVTSFGYSKFDDDKGKKNEEVKFFGNSETEKRRLIKFTTFIALYVVTSLIFAAFFVACLVLLARNNRPDSADTATDAFNATLSLKLEILRKDVTEMLASSQSEAIDKETFKQTKSNLSQKLDILEQNLKDVISSSQSSQAEYLEKVNKAFNINSDTLRREINEVLSIFQSSLPESVSKSPTYIASNQRVYELHKSLKNYTDAKEACRENNARLPADGVRDPVVVRELLEFVKSYPMSALCNGNRCYWIGLKYSHESYDWEWSDGESNSSTIDWAPLQTSYEGEDCALLYVEEEKIHDWPCDKKFYFLCEGLLPEETLG